MLDTVLELGKTLRAAPDGLKHHYLIKRPFADDKKPISFWAVPVNTDGSFIFQEHHALLDEYRQDQLLYLDYKDCGTDNKKMYVFGDIYHQVDPKKGVEASGGNFIISDDNASAGPYKRNSFDRLKKDDPKMKDFFRAEKIANFRRCFAAQWPHIKAFLASHDSAYLHFDFAGKHWYELQEMSELNQAFLKTFFQHETEGYVLRTYLYKTLSSDENRTCGFNARGLFRSRTFKDADDALSLLYSIKYASRSAVRKNDFMVIVLPRGETLTAAQIERFFGRRQSSEPNAEVEEAETQLQINIEASNAISASDSDEFFVFVDDDSPVLQYDCIFSKAGGTKPDVDMVEIAGLSRSNLARISENVRRVREEVQQERDEFFLNLYGKPLKKELSRLTIANAFLKIINDPTRKKNKYQSHLFRVIPQIFNDAYYQDPVLLPALIEKTEMQTRSDDLFYFNDAKFAFQFLSHLQLSGEERLMKIKQSPSYQVGLLLGVMARPLRPKIKSFDKNYAGLLSRRIATLADVMSLANEINQKLIMHEVLYQDVRQASQNLANTLGGFSDRYDKNECAFGFFESYFGSRQAAASEEATASDDEADNVEDQVA